MPIEWSKFDEKGLARHVIPEFPTSFQLPSQVNRLELIHWGEYRQLLEEIYNALKAKNTKYALEPFNSESNTQLIRTPQEILGNYNEGTCLDLAVLFCGICLACDLLPLLIILEGHALVAVSMHHQRKEWKNSTDGEREKNRKLFQDKPLDNHEQLEKLINSGDFLPIECTGFVSSFSTLSENMPEGIGRTEDGFLSFERAIEAGKEQLTTSGRKLKFAIDVAIAHEYWKIKPELQYKYSHSTNTDLSTTVKTVNDTLLAGYEFLQDKEFDKAEAKFNEAQKLENRSPEPWYWKAQLALAKDNKAVALNYINRALKLNPNYWYGIALKIKLLLLMGGEHREEAQEIATQSHQVSDELDLWLDCLEKNNCFGSIIVTNSELDAKCLFPFYKW